MIGRLLKWVYVRLRPRFDQRYVAGLDRASVGYVDANEVMAWNPEVISVFRNGEWEIVYNRPVAPKKDGNVIYFPSKN